MLWIFLKSLNISSLFTSLMQKSSLQIAGIVLIVMGITLQIVNYVVWRTIIIFMHPFPASIINSSTYEFIAHTIASTLILLGFFLILWEIGKRLNLKATYKNITIIVLILALLIPSFVGIVFIFYLLSGLNGVIVVIISVIAEALYPIGILFIGIALFKIATKLMKNKNTLY